MTKVVWASPAVDQLFLIRLSSLREKVHRAVGGLARFPLRGRVPPEVARHSDLDLPKDLREIVFPRKVRVFYRYDETRDTVRILGLSFRGQELGGDWFAHILED